MRRTFVLSMTVLAICVFRSAGLADGPALPLDVPLTVTETAGVDRVQDPCSTGVPIPCGLLAEPDGIAVFDAAGKAVPAQFRVLERWRDVGEGRADKSVRWLLVTFLADVPAGKSSTYRLKAGANPAPANPVKPVEKTDAWEMGGQSFKKDLASPFQFVLTDPDGKKISASELPLTWSVWESGPVRSCIKAESPTVPGKFGIAVWFYAYAGQQRIDMTVMLKNTPNERVGPLYFKDFSVIYEAADLKDAPMFDLGGQWGRNVAGLFGQDGVGQNVVLHQDSDGTDLWQTFGKDGQLSPVLDWTKDKSKCKAGEPAFRGYRVFSGDRELSAGNFAAGWAAVGGKGAGAFAAVRDYYQQFPKATEVAPGKIVMHLWPSYTKAFGGLHWLDDATRKAHDLSFRFRGPGEGIRHEECSRAFDFPLLASTPMDWNIAAGAISQGPAATPSKPYAGPPVTSQPASGRNWVNFGGDVTDQIRRRYHGADLGPFARTGSPFSAYDLYRTARHSGCITPLWLDDYQYPRDVKKLSHAQYCGLARDAGKYRDNTWHHGYMSWNDAHFCCQELFDGWRVFGDPVALDAVTNVGRWCQAWVDFREGGGGLVAGTRADGLPFHNLGEAYRILADTPDGESMRKSLDRFADLSYKQVDKTRGNYGIMDSWEGGNDKCEKPFMMAQVMKGLVAHYELTGSQRTADQIYGMTDFILSESSMGAYGFNYVVKTDPGANAEFLKAAREKVEKDGKQAPYGDLCWTMAWVYRHFGEQRFRAVCDGISVKAYPYVPRAYLAYYQERSDREPPAAVADLKAEALGGGKVRLTWTAPAGEAARYQVKFADRPIVERLNWPDEKEAKANWWSIPPTSAQAPKPAAGGAKETMTLEAVPAGKTFFAVRSFDAAGNRSDIGSVAEADVK